MYVDAVEITVFLCFESTKIDPLPVNKAVDINKPKICNKSVNLLRKLAKISKNTCGYLGTY